uniref:Uncharacterized protein n=1 Tax=Anguilla anguilla TaxID=7936 RepID=A0A0E9RYN3_ANGAN
MNTCSMLVILTKDNKVTEPRFQVWYFWGLLSGS